MKRTWIICLTLIAVLVAFGLAGAQTTKSGDVDDSSLLGPIVKKNKKKPVGFTHAKHSVDYKVACDQCHHVYEGKKNVWKEGDKVQKCSECHFLKKKNGKADKLKLAFHKNCKNCHKDLAKKKKDTGPYKKCTKCHTGKIPK